MKRPPKCVKGFILINVKFIVENITNTGSAVNIMKKYGNEPGMTKWPLRI